MDFNKVVYETINNFRIRPESYVPTLKKLKLTMSQLSKTKKNVDFVKEIDSFMNLIEKLPALQAIHLNPLLCKAAEKQLEKFDKTGVTRDVSTTETKALLLDFVENVQTAFMVINDSEDAESTINRMIFSNYDPEKKNRAAIMNRYINYLGVATKIIDGDNMVVIILSDKADEIKPKREYVYDELKQAFDHFDIHESGRVYIKEVVDSLITLGYDKKNPVLLSLLRDLDTKENEKFGVDWDTFSEHIIYHLNNVNTESGLKKLYELFIDDPHQDTITHSTLKRICRELDEPIDSSELKEMIERAAANGVDITFEEFYEYMKNKHSI
jgi:Ca2+-binding EF-hand superfamily protein